MIFVLEVLSGGHSSAPHAPLPRFIFFFTFGVNRHCSHPFVSTCPGPVDHLNSSTLFPSALSGLLMCMWPSLLGWLQRVPLRSRGAVLSVQLTSLVLSTGTLATVVYLHSQDVLLNQGCLLGSAWASCPCVMPKNCKGSKSRQLCDSLHLFPISQRFIVWCQVSWKPLFHKFCMGLFWFTKGEVKPVPVNSILDRSKSSGRSSLPLCSLTSIHYEISAKWKMVKKTPHPLLMRVVGNRTTFWF